MARELHSSLRFRLLKKAQTFWLNFLKSDRGRLGVISLIIFFIFLITILIFQSHDSAQVTSWKQGTEPSDNHLHLFIAIGSAPQNANLRRAARETWLTWLPDDGSVSYRFFTDAPPPTRTAHAAQAPLWRSLALESARHGDIIQQPLPTGYGDNEHNAYGRRALYQTRWAVQENNALTHFLRVDDDSFLCLHRLLYELKSSPREQFFWGRFWCKRGRNRADENFMLFSADVVRLLADRSITGHLLPFDEHVTFGWNFGYWSWILNLTIFDDQLRIDAQQGYLTGYMHGASTDKPPSTDKNPDMASFCNRYIYAHHVPEGAMRSVFSVTKTHLMYELPVHHSPSHTCKQEERSFIPTRHSATLPKLKLERVESATEST